MFDLHSSISDPQFLRLEFKDYKVDLLVLLLLNLPSEFQEFNLVSQLVVPLLNFLRPHGLLILHRDNWLSRVLGFLEVM